MINIIQQMNKKIIFELEKVLDEIFLEKNGDIGEVIKVLNNIFSEYGCKFLKYILEECDQIIKKSVERKKKWNVQENNKNKTFITEFGEVKYQRTYYKSKDKKGCTFLVDDCFGIERYQRMDDNLTAKMIDHSGEHSYQKSADLSVKKVKISRQTVKNKIRKLGEVDNCNLEEAKEKKKLKRLYVEADEDHISVQKKNNTIIKLVYIHEGIIKKNGRNKLKNAHYFSGIYKNTQELWLEVLDYIEANYEIDAIETIYLAGDGALWITEGLSWLPRSKYVLDRYHLNKYVLKATGHMPQKRHEIWEALNTCNYKKTDEILREIIRKTEVNTKKESVKEARKYILNNWGGIKIYKEDPYVIGCSAEGHVSHVLSSRMSCRPLGWSIIGADQMARIRAFKYNGGNRNDIRKLLEEKKKTKIINMQTEKILSKLNKRSLLPYPKEPMPAIKKGQITSLFKGLKALAY